MFDVETNESPQKKKYSRRITERFQRGFSQMFNFSSSSIDGGEPSGLFETSEMVNAAFTVGVSGGLAASPINEDISQRSIHKVGNHCLV